MAGGLRFAARRMVATADHTDCCRPAGAGQVNEQKSTVQGS